MEYYLTHGYADEQTQDGIEAFYKEFGFELEKSLEGQYRLIYHNPDGIDRLVAEDPASEDVYDKDCATCEFYECALNYASRHRLYIESLQDLADYINASTEWPSDVEDIIDRIGAESDCGERYGVCHTETEKVVINEYGEAEVIARDTDEVEHLLYAVFVTNGDAALVENIEQAEWLETLVSKSNIEEVTDEEEFEHASLVLDFAEDRKPRRIYAMRNFSNPNESGYFVYREDYEE